MGGTVRDLDVRLRLRAGKDRDPGPCLSIYTRRGNRHFPIPGKDGRQASGGLSAGPAKPASVAPELSQRAGQGRRKQPQPLSWQLSAATGVTQILRSRLPLPNLQIGRVV